MPKAKLVLPDGTEVTIDGTTEEVAELLDHYRQKSPGSGSAKRKPKKSAKERTTRLKKSARGPMGLMRALIEDGYFKTRRALPDVQRKLEEGGRIYAQTSLSPALLTLVQNGELRRLKEKKRWFYVHP